MLEFIVLGLVPGTAIQLTFAGIMSILTIFAGMTWWSFRAALRHKSRSVSQ